MARISTAGLGFVIVAAMVVASGTTGAAAAAPDYYLAVGGSGSIGFQPTAQRPLGQPTDAGYANDLLKTEAARWSNLKLLQIGCPGETTADALLGSGPCHYALGSQLATAVWMLRLHTSTVLITVDLGFNDIVPCLERHQVDEPCVDRALTQVHTQLLATLTLLKTVAGPNARIVGVDHYDPYLSAYRDGPSGQTFARSTLDVISRLDDTMQDDYAAAGIPMADVASAFHMDDVTPTPLPDGEVVPRNVAEVCDLTWKCAPRPLGPNPHPDDEGYRAIAEAISDTLGAH
ncbi:MAG TPA: SGNH/GDSL hydrolase family protein [Acidimicrobiales bacterium]|jgi:hypothetical protein|nr:SGNH/GDSL hydrolase family protein [Acidimicrobiales bacterium]